MPTTWSSHTQTDLPSRVTTWGLRSAWARGSRDCQSPGGTLPSEAAFS